MTRTCLLVIAACSSAVPQTRYYQLATPAATSPATADAGVTLALEPLATEQPYDDERIVYRVNPYRLDYYNYHRWSSPPGTLVADYLERALEGSGRFRAVTRATNGNAPVTLGGRVVAIEEVDRSQTQWIGRIVIELTLTDASTGELLWSEQYEELEPLPVQSPEGLARALSRALARIAAEALPQIAGVAGEHEQQARR